MAELYLSYKDKEYEDLFSIDFIKDIIDSVFNKLKKASDGFSISVYITDDIEMQEFNKKYRGIDSSTDVLSFANEEDALLDDVKKEHMLGDIVISYPFLVKNAEELCVANEEEAKRLIVHGVLHLLGYDHKTNDFEKEEMLIIQEEIVKA